MPWNFSEICCNFEPVKNTAIEESIRAYQRDYNSPTKENAEEAELEEFVKEE